MSVFKSRRSTRGCSVEVGAAVAEVEVALTAGTARPVPGSGNRTGNGKEFLAVDPDAATGFDWASASRFSCFAPGCGSRAGALTARAALRLSNEKLSFSSSSSSPTQLRIFIPRSKSSSVCLNAFLLDCPIAPLTASALAKVAGSVTHALLDASLLLSDASSPTVAAFTADARPVLSALLGRCLPADVPESVSLASSVVGFLDPIRLSSCEETSSSFFPVWAFAMLRRSSAELKEAIGFL